MAPGSTHITPNVHKVKKVSNKVYHVERYSDYAKLQDWMSANGIKSYLTYNGGANGYEFEVTSNLEWFLLGVEVVPTSRTLRYSPW